MYVPRKYISYMQGTSLSLLWAILDLQAPTFLTEKAMYEKTCQFQIKFIAKDYLQMYKTLQLFTNI
jgi:hypothetical protein